MDAPQLCWTLACCCHMLMQMELAAAASFLQRVQGPPLCVLPDVHAKTVHERQVIIV